MSLYAANSIPFLLVGGTATGKTESAEALLARLSSSMHTSSFSFRKSTNREDIKGILKKTAEEAKGQKSLLFLDDINLAEREIYGATPAIEVLRRYLSCPSIEGLNLIFALNPKGPGRSPLTPRVFSFFNVISFADYSESSL